MLINFLCFYPEFKNRRTPLVNFGFHLQIGLQNTQCSFVSSSELFSSILFLVVNLAVYKSISVKRLVPVRSNECFLPCILVSRNSAPDFL